MREKSIFHFKQFSIHHQHAAMKVGTDGVLLGAWAEVANAKRILDIGTGTGLIALMLAQRTAENVRIEAIEMEQHAYEEACHNVEQSPWKNRIRVYHQSLQEFSSEPFDLIVCNPPFFYNSMKPPDDKRMLARHADTLPMHMLAIHSKRLLHGEGTVSIILPAIDQKKIQSIFYENGMFCSRSTQIRTKKNKPPERSLLSFTSQMHAETMEEVVLLEDDGKWSAEYSNLTRGFYLKL